MALPALIESPRTEAGNVSFESSNVPDFSIEPSFISPVKRGGSNVEDLVERIQSIGKANRHNTPAVRRPLVDRRNVPAGPTRGEFTPLLKSVVKSNFTRAQVRPDGIPQTPAVLKPGYQSSNASPSLPWESTELAVGDEDSSYGPDGAGVSTILPPASSTLSTPLVPLPKSDNGRVLNDGHNVMSLREQENVVNRVEKENFGLKLKIHFLEESLRRAGPGVSEAALRENTDLKVDKVTLQKELFRYRKTLSSVEQDLETYRQRLAEAQKKSTRTHVNQGQGEEMQRLSKALGNAETEIQRLSGRLKTSEDRKAALHNGNVEELCRMRGELETAQTQVQLLNDQLAEARNRQLAADELNDGMEDLKAELREKERNLDEKDGQLDDLREEIVVLKNRSGQNDGLLEERTSELSRLKDDVSILKSDLQRKETLLQEKGNEVNDLKDEVVVLQNSLDEDSEQAKDELSAARGEIEQLNTQLQSLARERDAKDNQVRVQQGIRAQYEAMERDRDILQKQLQIYHDNEAQNEASKRERSLLQKELNDVRSQLETYEKERSSLQNELNDVRSQLEIYEKERSSLQRELAETRAQVKTYEVERDMLSRKIEEAREQGMMTEKERTSLNSAVQGGQAKNEAYRKEIDGLKKQLADGHRQHETRTRESMAMEEMIMELRSKISRLEKKLHDVQSQNDNNTNVLQECRELREMLKASKLEVEELRLQQRQYHQQMEEILQEKRELRARAKRLGDERAHQAQKASKCSTDMDYLRQQHDTAVAKVHELERRLTVENRAVQGSRQEQDKQHIGELRGLSKQILFLKKRCARENRFRADLAFVKNYFLMQAEMYDACNHAGLQMLEEMGIVPDRTIREKRPSLKCVVHVIMASMRIKRLKDEWARSLKVKEKLIASAAVTRGRVERWPR